MSKPKLILASSSKNRIHQLQGLNIHFIATPPLCDEATLKNNFVGDDIEALAVYLAKEKALSVGGPLPDPLPQAGEGDKGDALLRVGVPVLGVDQICKLGQRYFDKPITHEAAFQQLKTLQGQTHEIITALCIAKDNRPIWTHCEVTRLKMRSLSDTEIEAYLNQDKPYQSCGSYHFEAYGKWLFESIDGLESNIIGLPLPVLSQALVAHDIIHLQDIFNSKE